MSERTLQCPYHFIAIEGVIGVGKTSLCRLLAEKFGGRCFLEDFQSNPFIADFYRSPRDFAFKAQLFFLISRFQQHMEMPPPDMFHSPLIVDYIFQKDRIFASVNLDDNELGLYNLVCDVLEPRLRIPELVVYLQASTSQLLKRIRRRNREYEKSISTEYLEALNNAYNDFFFHYTQAPVFIVNTDEINFVDKPEQLDDLARNIAQHHSGITFYSPKGTL
ncbi:deoxynucleoside kinase [Candidatus Latescibacterota bacterium]